MRIYIAGLLAGARGGLETESPHLMVTAKIDYPSLLESYHYMDRRIVERLRSSKQTIFLDSGAFSMFTQGVEINLEAYAQYIKDHTDIIHLASNLDAIGAGQEQLSYDRQKELEGLGVDIQPVHHARDNDPWLTKYLNEGYSYIFLGGMVPESTNYLRGWLDHVWHHQLTNPDGTARVKVHGFGLTTLDLMFRYPWYSVDSTAWVMTSRFGSVYLDVPQPDGTIRDYKVDFSSRSSKKRNVGSWHFDTMSPDEQRFIRARLEQLEAERVKDPELEATLTEMMGFPQGYTPQALAESYGWRDHFNINYFRRAQDRRVDTFKRVQETLF